MIPVRCTVTARAPQPRCEALGGLPCPQPEKGAHVVVRLVIGVILSLVGLIWIAQGLDLIGGSGMSGKSIWAVLGAIALAIGLGMLGWATRFRSTR